jgi:predicted secreted acid phosphatase
VSKVISDIDGTIINFGKPIKATCDWLKKMKSEGRDIVYLTNRSESERATTIKQLKEINVPFSGTKSLIMNDTGEDAPIFKSEVIQEMIDDGEDIYAFMDDRVDTRAAVRKIDKKILVLDPAIKIEKNK